MIRFVLAFAVGCLVGCADQDAPIPPLMVLTASDLVAAFDELVPRFEAMEGQRVDVVAGSSGQLATQIRHGAPADLFLSADAGFVDGLIADGRIDAQTRVAYAVGPLALAVPPGRTPPPHLGDLRLPAYATLTIANPDHAPYGMAAREALRTTGVWDELGPRLILAENVAQAVQFVRTGNVDVAVVALSLVHGADGATLPHRRVDPTLHAPLVQVAGVVEGSRQPDAARRFLEYLLSPEGQAILQGFGFEPPPTAAAEEPNR
ncbi:MAG: molybdate ABC transporter substrate-binding protein [Gemmatimonadota bacterium]